ELMHDLGHALERREGEVDAAAGGVGARQSFAVDRLLRLLVEPDQIERVGLPLAAALLVRLEAERRVPAGAVADQHAVERVGRALPARPSSALAPPQLSSGPRSSLPCHIRSTTFAGWTAGSGKRNSCGAMCR